MLTMLPFTLLPLLLGSAGALVVPSALQQEFLAWKMTAFHHFSITTYTGSQAGNQDPGLFAPDPSTLNLTQWAVAAKAMGAPVAVLTSKHEAGFIIWQTDEPIGREFSIAHSSTVPSRDLVQEFVDACRLVGILPGLYFTTTDAFQTFKNVSEAVRRQAQLFQISELSTRYGEIAYFWFDHHAVTSSSDLWYEIDLVVRKNQPGAVVLGLDTSQVGGESGAGPYPWWYACDTVDNTSHGRCVPNQTVAGNPEGAFFKSAESDCSIFQGCHPWFCCGDVQTLAQSMGHWEATVGRGTEFIMNVPPNKSGVVDSQLVSATRVFGNEVARRYGRHGSPQWEGNGTAIGLVSGTLRVGEYLTLEFNVQESTVDRIWLSEGLAEAGQRVAGYSLEFSTGAEWEPIQLNNSNGGLTIGAQHIDILAPPLERVRMVRVRLERQVGDHGGTVELEMVAFHTGGIPPLM